MEAMRSDAFIHFVCGSRRVNNRLGVFLLIPKSPHIIGHFKKDALSLYSYQYTVLFKLVINYFGSITDRLRLPELRNI